MEFVNENNISDMEQASMSNDPGQRFRRIRQANQEVSRPSIVEPSLKEQVCYYTVRVLCSLGTNTKIPNTEHFKHWHTELRTFQTWPLDFETELRTGKTEHRTFVRLNQTWVFGLFLSFSIFFWQKNYKKKYWIL